MHLLGTKPLLISLVAQTVVLGVAVKQRDKDQVRECIVLLLALGLVVGSIGLRPPSPPNRLADILGAVAALCFVSPAVLAVIKMRAQGKS